MVEALDLEARDYPGTYKLVAGAPSLDFANLVSYRGTDRAHDWLVPAANLERWTAATGTPAARGTDIAVLRDVRELLARTFLAVAGGGTPEATDVDRLGARAADASARRALHFPPGADAATWISPRPALVDALALDAAALLTSADALHRVSACGGCRWLYLDTTRNRSRRWCDPADCGNRARQRRHYRRTRGVPR